MKEFRPPKERRRGRPRRDDGARDSQLAIRRAALQLFAEKGFEAASVRDIAARAAVDPALIAYLFGSKLGLWQSIVAMLGEQMAAEIDDALLSAAPGDAASQLRVAMIAFIDFNLDRPEVPGFLLRDSSHLPDLAAWSTAHLSKPYLGIFLPLLERARSEGQLRASCIEMTAVHFGYGVAVAIARRQLLVDLQSSLGDAQAFRAALQATLLEPVFV